MLHHVPLRRRASLGFALFIALFTGFALPTAQTPAKKVLGIEDYTEVAHDHFAGDLR